MKTTNLTYTNILCTILLSLILTPSLQGQFRNKRWKNYEKKMSKRYRLPSSETYGSSRKATKFTQERPAVNMARLRDSLGIKLDNPPLIAIKEIVDFMSQGKRPGLQVSIPNANANAVVKNWKKFLKTFGKRHKHRLNEVFSDNLLIPSISENTLDMFSVIEPYPGGVYLQVFIDLGGTFLSSKKHKTEQEVLANILQDFAITESVKTMEAQLKVQEKHLLKLSDERKELKKDEAALSEQSLKYKRALERANAGLKLNQKLQQRKNRETERQIQNIEQLKLNLKAVISNQSVIIKK